MRLKACIVNTMREEGKRVENQDKDLRMEG